MDWNHEIYVDVDERRYLILSSLFPCCTSFLSDTLHLLNPIDLLWRELRVTHCNHSCHGPSPLVLAVENKLGWIHLHLSDLLVWEVFPPAVQGVAVVFNPVCGIVLIVEDETAVHLWRIGFSPVTENTGTGRHHSWEKEDTARDLSDGHVVDN